MSYLLHHVWPFVVATAVCVIAVTAAGHAVLYKRDPRSAVGWIGIILLFPVIGPILYLFLGINRIQRRASKLRVKLPPSAIPSHALMCEPDSVPASLPSGLEHLASLSRVVEEITRRPLLRGNSVTPLLNGDAAYPAMIDAIDRAEKTVTLCTYIFANDKAGRRFIEALQRAVARGVDVRVLIDYVGSRYSFPPVEHTLRRHGVRTALFMPTLKLWRTKYMNLRSHRKILVVDGRIGFTGGANIRADNLVAEQPHEPVKDLHFHLTGPVVEHLQETFAEDWAFTTGEELRSEEWFPIATADGNTLARGITDGPDEDYDKLRRVIFGALACARQSVRIATPYFLPDIALISALNVAAMRGVDIEILLPRENNLRLVGWAMTAHLWQIIERGCRVILTAPPFDHTKAMIVDDAWCLLGSANWDPRSLRLNFEFNVECYDPHLAAALDAILDAKRATGQLLTMTDVNNRPLPVRLRDGIARLFLPYL